MLLKDFLVLFLILHLCICYSPRSEEADRGAFSPDGAQPLGGDPEGGLQARLGARGDQAAAAP